MNLSGSPLHMASRKEGMVVAVVHLLLLVLVSSDLLLLQLLNISNRHTHINIDNKLNIYSHSPSTSNCAEQHDFPAIFLMTHL